MSIAFAGSSTSTRTVSLYEAKTHLSALIEAVQSGETVTITKHGQPAARLVPIEHRRSPREAIDAWQAYRAVHRIVNDGAIASRDRSSYGQRY